MVFDHDEAAQRWQAHPLAEHAPLVATLLADFSHDARHIVVIADADGTLLWSAGHHSVLAAAERIGFSPGHNWMETATGTNGIGTALALDHAVQIFSAEHYNERVHGWTCSGAPVHDPETGGVVGVIDVSSGIRASHPHSLALAAAAARAVEAELWRTLAERREGLRARFFERVVRGRRGEHAALVDPGGRVLACHPPGWLTRELRMGEPGWRGPGEAPALESEPFGGGATIVRATGRPGREPDRPRLRIEALDRRVAAVRLDGVDVVLSPRRSELLVLLALAPDGIAAEALAYRLYGPSGRALSVRGEVSRLRAQLGPAIAANPYRITAELDADFLEPGADRRELLVDSRAPGVLAARH